MASAWDMKQDINDLPLLWKTELRWVDAVIKHFPLFLADHAANERKAAASSMEFVVRYPDRVSLVITASRIAQEEISHFRKVFGRMRKLHIPLQPDEKDLYVGKLLQNIRSKSDERLLDRLLISSIIEIRGIERFSMLSKHHPEVEWRKFYNELAASEYGHGLAFYFEAQKIFSKELVEKRFKEFLELEAEAIRSTPLTWRFH